MEDKSTVQGGKSDGSGWVGRAPQVSHETTTPMPGVNSTASYESMMDTLEILESRATGDTYGFCGFNFSSLHDVVAFVMKFGVPTYALYWDML